MPARACEFDSRFDHHLWVMGLLGVATCLADKTSDGFESRMIHQKILIDFYKKICYNIYVKIKKEIDIDSKLKVISGFV